MTTRRNFIKALASLPPVLAYRPAWAQNKTGPDPARLALVIGNGDYPSSPLGNPVNDAKAVTTLLTQAGFTVDSLLNATRQGMVAAIERFGSAAKRADTRQIVFYYAGHGAQLDWRNYLLPVDAIVEKQEHMKQRCVDLGLLLGQLSAAKDKTFIVILDACRNNPFGRAYRPSKKDCRNSMRRSAACSPTPRRRETSPRTARVPTGFTPKTWCANCRATIPAWKTR